jgi:hypothetical protein
VLGAVVCTYDEIMWANVDDMCAHARIVCVSTALASSTLIAFHDFFVFNRLNTSLCFINKQTNKHTHTHTQTHTHTLHIFRMQKCSPNLLPPFLLGGWGRESVTTLPCPAPVLHAHVGDEVPYSHAEGDRWTKGKVPKPDL